MLANAQPCLTMKKLISYIFFVSVFGKPESIKGDKTPDLSKLKKILIVRNDQIGDLICSLPVFEALKKACPHAKITLVASTYSFSVAKNNPYIDNILCYEKHKHSKRRFRFLSAWHQYRFLKRLRKENFDLAIGLRSHFSYMQGLMVFASGAVYRLGHCPKRPKYRHLSFFYNIHVPKNRENKHEVERSLDVIKTIGVNINQPMPLVVIGRKEKEYAKTKIEAANINSFPVIGYHISNRKKQMVWPLENFARLIELLKQRYPLSEHIITFAPGDQKRAKNLKTMVKNNTHVFATQEIKHLGAIQSFCNLFITLDGAPMHLAAALNVPTLALLQGRNHYDVWHPWGNGHRSLFKDGKIAAICPEEVYETSAEMIKICS